MTVVVFFQPINGGLLRGQYVGKPSAEHCWRLTCGTGLAKSWTPPWSVQSIPLCSAWKGAVEPDWRGVPRAPGNWKCEVCEKSDDKQQQARDSIKIQARRKRPNIAFYGAVMKKGKSMMEANDKVIQTAIKHSRLMDRGVLAGDPNDTCVSFVELFGVGRH